MRFESVDRSCSSPQTCDLMLLESNKKSPGQRQNNKSTSGPQAKGRKEEGRRTRGTRAGVRPGPGKQDLDPVSLATLNTKLGKSGFTKTAFISPRTLPTSSFLALSSRIFSIRFSTSSIRLT